MKTAIHCYGYPELNTVCIRRLLYRAYKTDPFTLQNHGQVRGGSAAAHARPNVARVDDVPQARCLSVQRVNERRQRRLDGLCDRRADLGPTRVHRARRQPRAGYVSHWHRLGSFRYSLSSYTSAKGVMSSSALVCLLAVLRRKKNYSTDFHKIR